MKTELSSENHGWSWIEGNSMKLLSHCVLCFRPLSWFFRRDWYAVRCVSGVDGIGKTWLIDIGAITLGWRDKYNARRRRNEHS